MLSPSPSIAGNEPSQEENRKKRLAESTQQVTSKKNPKPPLEAESKVVGKYLEAENFAQNALLAPGIASEIGKSGLIAAITGNPLAIKGFFAQEAAQFISRKMLVGVIDDLGKSMRHNLETKPRQR